MKCPVCTGANRSSSDCRCRGTGVVRDNYCVGEQVEVTHPIAEIRPFIGTIVECVDQRSGSYKVRTETGKIESWNAYWFSELQDDQGIKLEKFVAPPSMANPLVSSTSFEEPDEEYSLVGDVKLADLDEFTPPPGMEGYSKKNFWDRVTLNCYVE